MTFAISRSLLLSYRKFLDSSSHWVFRFKVMNSIQDLELIWACGKPGHDHPSWDGAERCNTDADPQVEQLQKAVTKLALSCMRALDALKLLLPPDHQRLQETYSTIHKQLCMQYISAGEPYGRGEEAMWKWVKERAEN